MSTLHSFLAVFLLSLSVQARAAMPVEVISTSPDTVGTRLIFAIKEQIRASESLALTFDKSIHRLQVEIVTLDPSRTERGESTVYSVVITWKAPGVSLPLYLSSHVAIVSSRNVTEAAEATAADISEESDSIIRFFQNTPKP